MGANARVGKMPRRHTTKGCIAGRDGKRKDKRNEVRGRAPSRKVRRKKVWEKLREENSAADRFVKPPLGRKKTRRVLSRSSPSPPLPSSPSRRYSGSCSSSITCRASHIAPRVYAHTHTYIYVSHRAMQRNAIVRGPFF